MVNGPDWMNTIALSASDAVPRFRSTIFCFHWINAKLKWMVPLIFLIHMREFPIKFCEVSGELNWQVHGRKLSLQLYRWMTRDLLFPLHQIPESKITKTNCDFCSKSKSLSKSADYRWLLESLLLFQGNRLLFKVCHSLPVCSYEMLVNQSAQSSFFHKSLDLCATEKACWSTVVIHLVIMKCAQWKFEGEKWPGQ